MNYYISLFLLFWSITGYSNNLSVAIIDTGVNPPAELSKYYTHINYSNSSHKDTHGHGSNVAGLIYKNAGSHKYNVYSIKALGPNTNSNAYINALRDSVKLKPTILNISGGGFDKNWTEEYLINLILKNGTIIVAAAGNEGENLDINGCNFYPACYSRDIIMVGNTSKTSNYGKVVDFVIDGNDKEGFGYVASGSSQSTAIMTGIILKGLINERN